MSESNTNGGGNGAAGWRRHLLAVGRHIRGGAREFGMKCWGEEYYEFPPEFRHIACATPLLEKPEAYGLQGFQERELHLNSGEHVTAWYKPAGKWENGTWPTIVYCHGNAGTLPMRAPQLQAMGERGYGVLIAAYPGFKGHMARAKVDPNWKNTVATGHAMVREMVLAERVPSKQLVLFGESLGGAVALQTMYDLEQPHNFLGKEPVNIGGLMTWGTFASMPLRAKDVDPDLPGWFIENRFPSDAIIAMIKHPEKILLMHGDRDEITDKKHSGWLHAATKDKARFREMWASNHGLTHEGTTIVDTEGQLKRMIHEIQQFLHELGLCPAPVREEAVSLVSEETNRHSRNGRNGTSSCPDRM